MILPVLLSLVGLTDGVHLMVQIRKLRAEGLSEREAARLALHEVGYACMLTSLTTAIGFGSLGLAHKVWVQDFGWCSVLGVFLTFVSVISIIPLICGSFLGRNIHLGHEKSLIHRNLTKIGGLVEWVLRYPKAVSVTGIALTIVLTGISLTLRRMNVDRIHFRKRVKHIRPLRTWIKHSVDLSSPRLRFAGENRSRRILRDPAGRPGS